MKILLATCISMFASVAMSCTDFSGNYRNEKMEVFSIAQTACESLVYTEADGDTKTFIADGQYRVTDEEQDVRILTATTFVGDNATFDSKIEYIQPLPVDVPEEAIPRTSKLIFTKDANGNLVGVATVYNSAGQVLGTATSTHPKV